MTFTPVNSQGPFLPTTQVFPEDESQRLIVLTENYTDISLAVNQRVIGYYNTNETVNGKQFYNPNNAQSIRNGYRKVVEVGALAAGATSSIAHGITGVNGATTFTSITGTCVTSVPDNRPIPYASATAVNTQIEIKLDATNIVIINGAAAPAIASGIVILEYLKN